MQHCTFGCQRRCFILRVSLYTASTVVCAGCSCCHHNARPHRSSSFSIFTLCACLRVECSRASAMVRTTCMRQLLLLVLLICLCSQSALGQAGGWCQTGVRLLPNLTDLLSSTSHHYFGAADDECSSFYFSALDVSPSASSPSVVLRFDEALNVSLINDQPIPASLLAAGFRYITDMEYFNLHLFAPIASTVPLLSASSSSVRHRSRGWSSSQLSSNASSGIAVLSRSNLTVLQWYPLPEPVALQQLTIDYGDASLYASAALSVSALFRFSIATDGRLSRLADVKLASRPSFDAIRGSALFYPGGLLFYVSWPAAERQLSAQSRTAAEEEVSGAVLQYDVKSQAWSSLLNTSTALPVTSMADLWSTSQPNFGSMHIVDGRSLYNYDSC